MGDVGIEYREREEAYRQRKDERRQENIAYLEHAQIDWKWVDRLSDHIHINGVIDYYLGKTYWFTRKTKARGYTMLNQLMSS